MSSPLDSPRLRWILFLLVVLAQLAVPVTMIRGKEKVLAEGELYRFRTAPVDPYDAFQGRYVALGFDEVRKAHRLTSETAREGQRLYAVLERDGEGFAHIKTLLESPPASGDYLRVKVRSVVGDSVTVSFPFDRYYLEEDLAPAAEQVYWDASRAQNRQAWVEVRVLAGKAALEELYLDGKPIHEALQP
jgi:uncharacterized membrane-anchored protein